MGSRSSYIITYVFMVVTAFVLAEICSALPISGSIYIWAAASAGPKYARFFGFLVAWWSCAGWVILVAALCQVGPYLVIQITLQIANFPHPYTGRFLLHGLPTERLGGRFLRRGLQR